jgi:hypothetical protein
MPFISGDVMVEETSAKQWKLLQDVVYEGATETITVSAGFVTDFASIPRVFFWLFPTYGAYTKAAIVHDYLCETKIKPRNETDGIFRRAMHELGVPFLRRWMMWAAVRIGSRLTGATPFEFVQWVAIAVPSIIFLLIPAVVVEVWLVLFWLIELVFYGAFKLIGSKKKLNYPTLLPSSPKGVDVNPPNTPATPPKA